MNEHQTTQYITRLLNQSTRHLSSHQVDRLRLARQRALSSATSERWQLAGAPSGMDSTGGKSFHGMHLFRAGALLFLLTISVLFSGYYWQQRTQQAADDEMGQLDANLLASDIPLQTFAQKDFGTWLEDTR